MRLFLLPTAALCIVAVFGACRRDDASAGERRVDTTTTPNDRLDSARRNLDRAWTDFKDWTAMQKDEFATNARQRLDAIDDNIEELRQKVAAKADTTRESARTAISEVEEMRRDVDKRIETVKTSAGETWREARQDLADALNKLGNRVDELRRQYF